MKFTIQDRFPSLNEYTNSNRKNRYAGADMKARCQKQATIGIKLSKLKPVKNYPITLEITWYEKDRRRDLDNITYAVKFINDALVKSKIIIDDSQKYVRSIINHVEVDSKNPRIEIKIIERRSDGRK